jgi:hypothetical protein
MFFQVFCIVGVYNLENKRHNIIFIEKLENLVNEKISIFL